MASAPAEPTPLSSRRGRSSSLSTALAPLSISPNSSLLMSSEFKNAFHQRSASSSSAIPIDGSSAHSSSANSPFSPTLPLPLSNSPTSTASSIESERLTTPSSSPSFVYPLGGISKAKSLKEYAIDEVDTDDDGTETIFAGGARWGWPQQNTPSSPTMISRTTQRRASLGPAPLTAPLGRVQSASGAYAAPSSANKGSENGIGSWGIFRRLSQSSNFAGRPKPPCEAPSMPSTASYQSPPTTTTASFPPMASTGGTAERGRKVNVGPPKAKRKLSPMGERMLTGLHH